jgi:hypothetical protein
MVTQLYHQESPFHHCSSCFLKQLGKVYLACFLKQLGKVYLAQSEENADVLVFHSMVFEFDFVTTCVHPVPSVADLALGVRC